MIGEYKILCFKIRLGNNECKSGILFIIVYLPIRDVV